METDNSLYVQIEEQFYNKIVDARPDVCFFLEGKELETQKKYLVEKRKRFDRSCGLKFVSITRKGTLDGEDEFEDYVRYIYYHNFKVVNKGKYAWAKIKYGI